MEAARGRSSNAQTKEVGGAIVMDADATSALHKRGVAPTIDSFKYVWEKDAAKTRGAVLACTDEAVLPVSQVFEAIRELGDEGVEKYDPLVVTSASSRSKLPVETSSVDIVILIWQSLDCPTDQLVQEVLRLLKVGGTTLILKSSQSAVGSLDKIRSVLESKLLLAGFSETQVLQLESAVLSGSNTFGIKAKKPSWKVGFFFCFEEGNQEFT